MFKAAILLSQQYNIRIDGKFIEWETVQTGGSAIGAISSSCRMMPTSNIVGIVGPAFSREAHIIATFAETIGIPVISYSATDPDLSDRNAYPNFYRTVSSDNAAVLSIVKLFIQYNWTSCIVIYQNDAFGSGAAKIISEVFNDNGLVIKETIIFDIATLRIRGDLKNILLTSSTRIVVLWADTVYLPLILKYALDSDVLGPQFTWILPTSVSLNSFNQTLQQKLIGMLSVEPVIGSVVNAPINTTLLNAAYTIWQQYEPQSFPGSTEVDYSALFASDATWSLIQSLQKLCSTTINSSSSCTSIVNSSFCFDRRFLNTDLFLNTISNTIFLGVSGLIQFTTNITDRINGVYYVVKNIQPNSNTVEFVPVLVWSDIDDWKPYTRTNVIVWPGNSLIPPTGRAIMLGVSLRIGVVELPPFTMKKDVIDGSGQSSIELIGYMLDLIDLLQNKLGFIPQITLISSNESYNELLDAVANGVYDMIVADVTITAARREKVDFSSSIFDNSLRIITRKKFAESLDLIAYLRPLSLHLWMLLLVVTLCAGFLICLFERQENKALQNRSMIASSAMSIWYSFGHVMGYGVDFQVTTAAGRLLTAGLYMLSLIVVATYTANLASNLTTAKTKNIISGIDDIKNGKVSFSRIGILDGSSIEDYYLREISGKSRNFYPLQIESDLYSNLIKNVIDVGIMDAGVLEYATSSLYCNLTLVGADFEKSAFGIVIPKEWLYAENLDVNILSLRESGELDNLKRKWFQSSTCFDAADTPTGTSINALSGLFATFAVVTSLAIFLYVWKKWHAIKNSLLTLTHRTNSLAETNRARRFQLFWNREPNRIREYFSFSEPEPEPSNKNG